jgi:hypothetical protein
MTEAVAIFTGVVVPIFAADIDDDAIRILLNELASEIWESSNRRRFIPSQSRVPA